MGLSSGSLIFVFCIILKVCNADIILYTCNFEQETLCPQLSSQNNLWKVNKYGTPEDYTGPSQGADGSIWYVYFDSKLNPQSGSLVYTQDTTLPNTNIVLSFKLHAYGANCVSFNVLFKDTSGAVINVSNPIVLYNQLQTSNLSPYTLYTFNMTSSFQKIEFVATSNGVQGNYAIDDISLTAVTTCSSFCHPNATCLSGSCVCNSGFTGDGVNNCTATCPVACNSNATCVETTCVCKNGFIGDGVTNCTATCTSACNPNATCVGTTCVCKNGFVGDGVSNCTATCASACNPNATCVGTTCVCNNGFIGDGVNTCTATCTSACNPNATCVGTTCVCKNGFIGDGVSNCTATCASACNPNATCVGTTCVCKNGFIGDGVSNCTATCASACNANATCVGTTCICNNGFIGDGVNTCTATCASACNPNATCVGTACICNNGFIGDGVNTCTATCTSACNPNATCVGTTCVCKNGFIGDGVSNCTATCASACNPNATCVGTSCVCKNGFIGDGVSNCTATCASACNPNATCVGTTCICNNGFIGDGVNTCTATCTSACNPNATCVGTACICNKGFIGDGVNTCTATCSSACNPNATCVGTTCICKNGFIGDGVSNCTATCASACNPNATCVGTTCVCKNGFIGDGVSNCTATCASACNPNATCVGTTCVCKNGFIGDGVDNCIATCSSACNPNATCIGTTCVCNSGYFGDGIYSCTVPAICSSCHPNATCNGTACVCKNGYNGDGINSCIGTCSTGGFASCSNILLYNCDFEQGVICSQLSSTNNAWTVNRFATPLDRTGPSGAANGLWYIYFDSVKYPKGGTLVYTQINSILSNSFILSFNLHAFGVNCIQFEIKFKNANGDILSAPNAFVVYNQTQMSSTAPYIPYSLQFNLLSPFQTIEFIAISNGLRANYAIDNIVLMAVPPCLLSCNSNATCSGTTCVCKPGFIGDGVNSCTATCPSACNPNATCVSTTCVCNKGFIGDGVSQCTATCATACNSNATCVGTTCVCKNGFIGDGINNCTATCSSACNSNATCVGTTCVCKNGFIGDGINNCTATCSSTCNPNAICVGTTCVCKNGFIGDGIINCTATCSSTCNPNAICVGTTCVCKNGFIGDGINNCTATCSSACNPNATCVGTSCVCKNGFIGDGINNCTATCSSTCNPNAICVGTTCVCKNGFIGDGINNCTATCSSACNSNATCVGTTCVCKNGFIGDGINNCTATCSSTCNSNAICVGTTCVCKNGFIGDGINNCTATCSSTCNPNAICVGTTCVCKNGFIGDGINNCTATCSSTCNPNAICVGTTCVCKNGFIGDGINNCTATCSSTCNSNAICVGTTCVCKNGFIGDGINNCTATCSSTCNPNAICVGTTCVCKNGFIGDGINNCTATCSSTCNSNAICVGTTCVCKNGFIGDGINNCTATCSSACNPNATCVGTTCICKNGFIGDGVNSCTATCPTCNPNATCIGSTCVCNKGFIGDGVNQCTVTCANVCHPNAICVGTNCVCKSGFFGDGVTNCAVSCQVGTCNPNAFCSGATCICKNGFIGDGTVNCSATCSNVCHPNAYCQGTTCVCNNGFVGDGVNSCYALPTSLTAWGSWSACIESICGNGVQSRQRSCVAQCGAVLQSDLYQVISCQTSRCFNNTLTQWSGYSDCSATCGSNGVRTRYRTCSPLVQNGCVGIELTNSIFCDEQACPQIDVTNWSSWTGCSSSCVNTASPSQWRWRSCSCGNCSQCDNSVTVVDSRTCNNVPCDSSCRSSMISYIIVIDSSSSVTDYYWGLERNFVKRFAASVGFTSNTTFGLVNFASTARTEFGCRSFTDATSFNAAIDSVSMITGGTAINAGLTQAINLMQSPACRGKKVLLFTTDGQENIEKDPSKISATYETVRSLANYIYIPYVNNPEATTYPDPVALDKLVANGKGLDKEFTSYSDVNDATYIPDLVLSGLCMDNSAWTSWSSPSVCSISCGGTGFTYRQRTCLNGGNVATNCPGADFDVSPCYTSPCSYLTNWNSWSDCSSSCRQNLSTSLMQIRTRSCVQNVAPCQGVLLETRECNTNVFCGGSWGNWGPYSACSATCSLGSLYSSTMVRSRLCLNDTFYLGCVGSSIDIAPCNTQIGCPGILTVWSTWSGCEGQCQQDPITSETRTRRCVDALSPFNCNGTKLIESRNCFEGLPCQGSWNSWSNWTSCSQSCFVSNLSLPFQSRNRVCVGSTLTGNCYGGKSSEIQTCNTNFPCPGYWSEWGPYTPCSETCQSNVMVDPKQVRRRVCLNAVLGGACEGSNGSNEQYQTIACNQLVICPVMGTWTSWSAWSACSSSCDMGFSTRTRICTQPNIPSAGNDCVGNWNQTTSCNNGDCPKYCNIPKSCNCSQVPQFNNFTTFLGYINLNMTSVDNVLLRLSPWTVDYVNESLDSCNIPRLTSSLDRLMQDISTLNMVKTRLEMLINNTQFAITCNSNIPITNELWNYFDHLYERVVFLTAVNTEFEAFRIRYDAAISACKQYGWFHQLLFNVAQRYF
ncbi:neurogenic locus notch homolog protein 2 isoform X47 [Hydra vulgaris]|uniref:neurogenic locus notch homolog protein 2 isoform X47 n=1 Tax=Hydra vulgaris TaxID=6087 RepID=UPI0032EA1835